MGLGRSEAREYGLSNEAARACSFLLWRNLSSHCFQPFLRTGAILFHLPAAPRNRHVFNDSHSSTTARRLALGGPTRLSRFTLGIDSPSLSLEKHEVLPPSLCSYLHSFLIPPSCSLRHHTGAPNASLLSLSLSIPTETPWEALVQEWGRNPQRKRLRSIDRHGPGAVPGRIKVADGRNSRMFWEVCDHDRSCNGLRFQHCFCRAHEGGGG